MTTTVVTQDETAIREVFTRMETDMRAGDVDRLLARFTPDAVQCSLAPPLRIVGPDVHDADSLAAWFGTFASPVDYEVRDLTVELGGDVAFAHGVARMTATPAGSTEPFTLWFRLTTGLRKVDGEWKVAHEHQSVPFYMDGSLRACVDLEP